MKLPAQVSAVARPPATPTTLHWHPGPGASVTPAQLSCPTGYYACYCSDTNNYHCCPIDMGCNGNRINHSCNCVA
jgi:hypothetical protein